MKSMELTTSQMKALDNGANILIFHIPIDIREKSICQDYMDKVIELYLPA